MRLRGGDSEEQVTIRLATARREMAEAAEFDYTVVNDDLVEAANEIERIIAEERARPNRYPVEIA